MPLDEFQQLTLQECMQREGCPLCRAVWRMDAARFSWYVNDGVLDEETRRNMVRALGFCAPHALYLSLIEGNGFLWSHLGSCMVYVDVIKHALLPKLERALSRSGQRFLHSFTREIFSPLRHLFHHDLCPLCFDQRLHEATYREQFTKAFTTHAGFRQTYLQADSLCFPHFQQVRSALPEGKLVRMLEVAQFRALKQCEQAKAPTVQRQLRQHLCLLYGSETMLWSDFLLRAALHPSQVGPPPCLACQEGEYGMTQISATLLERFEEVSRRCENSEEDTLSVCPWHAWWLLHQVTGQPTRISQVEPALGRTNQVFQRHVGDALYERRVCQLCEWVSELETLQVGQLQRQLRDPVQPVRLCLPHARAALRQSSDEETAQDVARALMHAEVPIAKRLEAYIYKCTERFQVQMQPDELAAWFDAIRWFGGSETAQFLLTSASTTEAPGG
jgi:hypothetical protein